MDTNQPLPNSNPAQKNKETDPSVSTDDKLVEKEENTGMDMGADFEPDKEQDMDDLVHSQAGLHKKNDIPPPDDI